MTLFFKIVDTDNFGGDYPHEYALSMTDYKDKTKPLLLCEQKALAVADALNAGNGTMSSRYWAVRPANHKLGEEFEP